MGSESIPHGHLGVFVDINTLERAGIPLYSTLGRVMGKAMYMTKTEAHKILDLSKIDKTIPYNVISRALIATGDLDLFGTRAAFDRPLRRDGDEPSDSGSREIESPAVAGRRIGHVVRYWVASEGTDR